MIKVSIRTNDVRTTIMADPNMTIKEVLEQSGVNFTGGQTSIDGVTMQAGDAAKTLAQLGYDGSTDAKSKVFLVNVAKQDNA